mmetsp:Transcript_19541/g.44469  ORF Transcript_19541/g.44469 Transcript_19541/m.44469 type:complete len:238 (+) Transcript_19541:99-812(+)|eukprot:CAMPEP_0197897056 /NCGR_PEP_ID=MMETSP1439-20131203/41555_1 /TAXON_ID=66791 /ORGANISM="Gonyaulax spinifera, Strain CCMP409" /LENGTH=237 /DNA_ID=CAMNT_0043517655 /DNA_START=96 /DNA_END=809 /DNA_ORIENTATION=-
MASIPGTRRRTVPAAKPVLGRQPRASRASAAAAQGRAATRTAPSPVRRGAAALFDRYRDQSEDAITAEGIERFCTDLGVSTLDPVVLVIALRFGAARMGIFSREEFVTGMSSLGCDSTEKLRGKLEEMRAVLADPFAAKEVYVYTFQFALDQGQRCLPKELCIELWKLLLRGHFLLLDEWIAFAEKRAKDMISSDTWMMLWEFATEVNSDLSNYDEDSAWPVLMDEFVEVIRSGRKT